MPTQKPRISVTLDPHDYEVIRRMSQLKQKSMSYVLGEFISSATPIMERACVAIETARKAEESIRPALIEIAEDTQRSLTPFVSDAIDQLDIFIDIADNAKIKKR